MPGASSVSNVDRAHQTESNSAVVPIPGRYRRFDLYTQSGGHLLADVAPVTPHMSRLDDIGAADGWRCWLCDEAVDPTMSVNDGHGPSIDSLTTSERRPSRRE